MLKQILLIASFLITANAQNLTFVHCDAKLPTPRAHAAVIYDGDDSIFIFGGSSNEYWAETEVLKFSLSSETLNQVGNFTRPISKGTVAYYNDKFYHIGGTEIIWHMPEIFEWDPVTGNVTKFGEFKYGGDYYHSMAQLPGDKSHLMYIVGGDYQPGLITEVDLRGNLSRPIYNGLPINAPNVECFWDDRGDGTLFIIGSMLYGYETSVLKYEPWKDEVTLLTNEFPRYWYTDHYTAIWDGTHAYLVGGINDKYPPNHILKYDPLTNEVEDFKVDNFPTIGNFALTWTMTVYVPKLNRIYMFGGLWHTLEPSQAFYTDFVGNIDLTPVNGN